MTEPKIQRAIRAYITLRNEISARKKALKESLEELEAQKAKLGNFLLAEAERQGVDSFATSEGTAFKKATDRVSVTDWDAVLRHILTDIVRSMKVCSSGNATNELVEAALQADSIALLNQAVNKTAVKAYMMEHDQIPPQGVEYSVQEEVQVRAPSKRKKQK